MSTMNWKDLYFGKVARQDVQKYIPQADWQEYRKALKGLTTEQKYAALKAWLVAQKYSHSSKVQVTNYVTALSRGGLIKPSDYREE